jgi:hypothetical protein
MNCFSNAENGTLSKNEPTNNEVEAANNEDWTASHIDYNLWYMNIDSDESQTLFVGPWMIVSPTLAVICSDVVRSLSSIPLSRVNIFEFFLMLKSEQYQPKDEYEYYHLYHIKICSNNVRTETN